MKLISKYLYLVISCLPIYISVITPSIADRITGPEIQAGPAGATDFHILLTHILEDYKDRDKYKAGDFGIPKLTTVSDNGNSGTELAYDFSALEKTTQLGLDNYSLLITQDSVPMPWLRIQKTWWTIGGDPISGTEYIPSLPTYLIPTPVPIPAGIWLLGSALVGVFTISQRNRNSNIPTSA